MHIATCKLRSVSPYQQRRKYNTPKLEKEAPADYEKRTWRDSGHYTDEGNMYIPPTSFKRCIEQAATMLDKTIPGRGKNKYKKHFLAGIMVVDKLILPVTKDTVSGVWVFVPSNGRRGGSTRVDKCYPTVQEWEGTIDFIVLDDTITEDVFREHLIEAGRLVGLGVFRPQNGGYHGRFEVISIVWKDQDAKVNKRERVSI
jgi:hypothetical protein